MGAISDFMSRDHDRLDAIFAGFQRETDAARAGELFAQFDTGLRTHIAWEEEILFPPFERLTGMSNSGPTAVMRMEHRQIEQHLQSIREAIGRPETARFARSLLEVLGSHNHKEEAVLYPWLDQSLPDEEVTSILDRIRTTQAGAGRSEPR